MSMKNFLEGYKAVNPYATTESRKTFELDLPKGARSVKDPSEVPDGWNVVRGPQGGVYAVPGKGAKGGDKKQQKPDKKKGGDGGDSKDNNNSGANKEIPDFFNSRKSFQKKHGMQDVDSAGEEEAIEQTYNFLAKKTGEDPEKLRLENQKKVLDVVQKAAQQDDFNLDNPDAVDGLKMAIKSVAKLPDGWKGGGELDRLTKAAMQQIETIKQGETETGFYKLSMRDISSSMATGTIPESETPDEFDLEPGDPVINQKTGEVLIVSDNK